MASISCDGGEKDMISGLPEEVLSHILSFLPLEDAIKSTLLLKRFRNLWRSFPRLTIDTWSFKWGDHSHSDDQKLAKLIHHVLIYHEKARIDELCLRHCFLFEYSKNPNYSMNPSPELQIRILEEMRFAGVLDSFVSFAIIKRCKVLELAFINTGDFDLQQGYILPTIVYRSIHLTQLSLGACDITSCDEVCLKSLKILRFKAVVMSDNAMEKILSGCPSLKELSVDRCYGLRNLCFNNNINLEILMIIHFDDDELLTVSNVNVVYLNIEMDWPESVVISKATVVDAKVCCDESFPYEEGSYEGFKFLLQSLNQCKTFRPNTWSVVVLAIWELTNTPCPYFNWKRIVVELHLRNCVQIGLSMLLRHVPLLETLRIHVQPKPVYEVTDDNTRWLLEYELDEDKYWNEEQEASRLANLKIVLIHGACIAEPATIRVAKFLLRNAVALEKMVISTKKKVNPNGPFYIFTCDGIESEKNRLLTDELTSALENLVTSSKASAKAVIYFA